MPPHNGHQGSNAAQKPPNPVCMPKMNPFFQNMPIYRAMATTLQTDEDYLLALSSMESGWLNPHNQGLHNLFGVTQAGGNNLNFPTYQASADYWVRVFGPHVQGAKTMDAFADGLRKAHYNTVNPNYYAELKRQLGTVRRFKLACDVH